jgi:hypothetical protein
MKILYGVSNGESYSDYIVAGYFETREEAERFLTERRQAFVDHEMNDWDVPRAEAEKEWDEKKRWKIEEWTMGELLHRSEWDY